MFDIIMPNKSTPVGIMRNALISIQEQSYQDWICYIMDDTPEDWKYWDRYQEMLSEFLQDSRFQLIRSETSSPSTARNKGIDSSQGDWIAFLDSDDVWFADHLTTLAKGLEHYDICFTEISKVDPHCDLVNLNGLGIDGRVGVKIDVIQVIQRYEMANFIPDEYQGYFWYGAPVWFSALGCQRKVFQDTKFNEELMIAEDTDLLLQWVRQGFYPRLIPHKTVHRSIHDNQLTKSISQDRHNADMDIWLERNKDFLLTEEILLSMPIHYRDILKQNNDLAKERNMFLEHLNFDIISEEDYEIEML